MVPFRIRTLLVTLCIFIWSFGSAAADGASTDVSNHVAVIIASTKLALGVDDDIERIKKVFQDAQQYISAERKDLTITFTPPHALRGVRSREELFDLIQKPDIQPNSTLVLYCKMHGGCSPNGQHFLYSDVSGVDSMIARDDIVKRLRLRKARLTVLITDSCSSGLMQPTVAIPQEQKYPTDLIIDLFVRSRGFVDINSSSSHDDNGRPIFQAAWMDADGAIFTKTFAQMLSAREPEVVDGLLRRMNRNGRGPYGWNDFFPALVEETEKAFETFKAEMRSQSAANLGPRFDALSMATLLTQEKQTPRAFELPDDP